MWQRSLLFIALSVIAVQANDIRLGYSSGHARKIFSEIREANPAIWTRTDEVNINTVGSEVISAVYVTDLRDLKDGVAYIDHGGVGAKSVTISLKSPAVFRGYKFAIEVYAENLNHGRREDLGSNHARVYNSGLNTKGGYQPEPYYDEGQYARKY